MVAWLVLGLAYERDWRGCVVMVLGYRERRFGMIILRSTGEGYPRRTRESGRHLLRWDSCSETSVWMSVFAATKQLAFLRARMLVSVLLETNNPPGRYCESKSILWRNMFDTHDLIIAQHDTEIRALRCSFACDNTHCLVVACHCNELQLLELCPLDLMKEVA